MHAYMCVCSIHVFSYAYNYAHTYYSKAYTHFAHNTNIHLLTQARLNTPHTRARTHIRMHMHTHARTHTNTHTHKHTYTH